MRIAGATHWIAEDGPHGYEYARLPSGLLVEVQRPWPRHQPRGDGLELQTTEWRTRTPDGDWVPSRRPSQTVCSRLLLGLLDVPGEWPEDGEAVVLDSEVLEAHEIGEPSPKPAKRETGCTPGQVMRWARPTSDYRPFKIHGGVQYRRQLQGAWYTHRVCWDPASGRAIEWLWSAAGWRPWREVYRDPETGRLDRGEIVGSTRPCAASVLRATKPSDIIRPKRAARHDQQSI